MGEPEELIAAYLLDGHGRGRSLGWAEIRSWKAEQETLWVHLDRLDPTSQHWLREESGVEPLVCEALLAEETRPRTAAMKGGVLVILRGVNQHPGADPEDMVAIRMWIESRRVITLRHKRLMAVQDVRENLDASKGPRDAADLLVQIAARLIDRMGPVIEELEEGVDGLEEQVLTARSHELRSKLADLRRQAITLRRYIAPQRDAMSHLQQEDVEWITPLHRARLREIGDRTTRYVEDLDAARERAAVTHEELLGRLSEQMNRTMYVLSIVAVVFLPLGLLTGLLGINVAGIPFADHPWAFGIVCVVLLLIAAAEVYLFRRLSWL
jgi:zinc transporter